MRGEANGWAEAGSAEGADPWATDHLVIRVHRWVMFVNAGNEGRNAGIARRNVSHAGRRGVALDRAVLDLVAVVACAISLRNDPTTADPLAQLFCRNAVQPPATVGHLTQVSFGSLPGCLGSPRQRLRLQAHVQPPAGTPIGTCMFERIEGSLPVRVAQTSTRNGICTANIRLIELVHLPTESRSRVPDGKPTTQAASHTVDVR